MSENEVDLIDTANERAWVSVNLDPHSALKLAEDALSSASRVDYPKGLADAWLNIGWATFYLSRYPDAYAAFEKAYQKYERIGDTSGICKTLNAFGVYYHSVSRLDKAIENYTHSLETARSNGLTDRELIAMANIGELCLELGNPQEALEYLIPAYDRMPRDFDPGNVADCLRNIGQAFLEMYNLDLAAEFTRKAYEIAIASGESIIATDSLETLANLTIAQGDIGQAAVHVSEGLALATKTGNLSQRAGLLVVQGSLFIAQGEPRKAVAVLSESELLCTQINLKGKLFKAFEHLSRAYEALSDFRNALVYYQRFSTLKAEVQNEESANKLRSIQSQAAVERAQQQAEIYRLTNIDLKEKSEALQDSNRQLTSISEMGRRITATLDFVTVVNTVYECLKSFLRMDMFGIALLDAKRGKLVYKRYFEDGIKKSDHTIKVDSDSSFAAWTFRNCKPVLITEKSVEYSKYLTKPSSSWGTPAESVVCLPLSIEDRAIGVMTVQNYQAHAYTPSHMAFLESLAPYVSIAVENAIIHDRLEDLNRALSDEKRRLERATMKISHLANHDSLTGLPNRRLLFELMGKAMETARRAGDKVGVVFIDLDDFKPINDRFGHAAGDNALVAMSERIRSLVRASDIVARIGGDEFVAAITNVKSRKDIERVANKVLSECSKPLSFVGKECSLGLSMGISIFPDDGQTIEELVNKADSAMYRVKHYEKNAFAFTSDDSSLD